MAAGGEVAGRVHQHVGTLIAPPTVLIDAISEGVIARLYARSRAVALNTAGSGAVCTHAAVALCN